MRGVHLFGLRSFRSSWGILASVAGVLWWGGSAARDSFGSGSGCVARRGSGDMVGSLSGMIAGSMSGFLVRFLGPWWRGIASGVVLFAWYGSGRCGASLGGFRAFVNLHYSIKNGGAVRG